MWTYDVVCFANVGSKHAISYKSYDTVRPILRRTTSYMTYAYNIVHTLPTISEGWISYVLGTHNIVYDMHLSEHTTLYVWPKKSYVGHCGTNDDSKYKSTTSHVLYHTDHCTYDVARAMLRTQSCVERTMLDITYNIIATSVFSILSETDRFLASFRFLRNL